MADLYRNVNGVRVQLTAEESASKVAEWKQNAATASATAYMRPRRDAYFDAFGDFGSEFDCIYHELETSGSLTTSGSWYQTIKSIKEANPKP
tara:strand:+ start:1440 stop:1715 length:276 start_codon:yes stop_codon:yes gene_type:complete